MKFGCKLHLTEIWIFPIECNCVVRLSKLLEFSNALIDRNKT